MELHCHRQKTMCWILMVSGEGGGSLFIRQHMFYMQNTMGACRCRVRALVHSPPPWGAFNWGAGEWGPAPL